MPCSGKCLRSYSEALRESGSAAVRKRCVGRSGSHSKCARMDHVLRNGAVVVRHFRTVEASIDSTDTADGSNTQMECPCVYVVLRNSREKCGQWQAMCKSDVGLA